MTLPTACPKRPSRDVARGIVHDLCVNEAVQDEPIHVRQYEELVELAERLVLAVRRLQPTIET